MFTLEANSQAAAFADPEALVAIDAMFNKQQPPFQWPVNSPQSSRG
jgi:hypothetical protein